jgi:hypothetical protein
MGMANVRRQRGTKGVAGRFIGEYEGASHGEGVNILETIALPGFAPLSRGGTLTVFVHQAARSSTEKGRPLPDGPFLFL